MPHEALHRDNRPALSLAVAERGNTSESPSSLYILWGFFALASIAAAVAVCFTPGAERRFMSAIAPAAELVSSPSPLEVARLNNRHTAPDTNDALIARLNVLEDQLGTMTGSISSRPAQIGGAGDMTPPKPAATTETASAATTSQPSEIAAPVATSAQTKFGLDLGAATSFSSLRSRWDALRKQHPELDRLSPRISVRDVDDRAELRLVAGPFDNAADAARACAGLLAKGTVCDGSLFDGQRLPQS